MSYTRYLPIPVVIVGIVVLTGALRLPPRSAAPVVPAGRAPDPAAEHLLDQALARYAPEAVGWLETTVKQHVCLAGLTFDAEGKHLQAPGNRYRTMLETARGDTRASWLAVSDGVHRWHKSRIGSDPWQDVHDAGLNSVLTTSASGGVWPVLRDLRARLNWVGREAGSREHQIRLVGVWKPEVVATLAPTAQPWPDGLPNVCRLCLDARSLWPTSIEWWGPTRPDEMPAPLASIEFAMPALGQALAPEECARLFAFDSPN